MANVNSTAASRSIHTALAAQYPCNTAPFGVWYNYDSDEGDRTYLWAVNDCSGEAIADMPSYEAALRLSQALQLPSNLAKMAGDLCVNLAPFFELAEHEIRRHNNTDWDRMEFLLKSAKKEVLEFDLAVNELAEAEAYNTAEAALVGEVHHG